MSEIKLGPLHLVRNDNTEEMMVGALEFSKHDVMAGNEPIPEPT